MQVKQNLLPLGAEKWQHTEGHAKDQRQRQDQKKPKPRFLPDIGIDQRASLVNVVEPGCVFVVKTIFPRSQNSEQCQADNKYRSERRMDHQQIPLQFAAEQ